MNADPARFRLTVAGEALRLFAENGYEATTVDEIAAAAGISRRTFFRQFHGKEDVVFADHEILLAKVAEYLSESHADPWEAVCEAAVMVFEGFAHWREVSRRRYAIVHEVPVLREREIVTIFRYERLFTDYLRAELPNVDNVTLVQFAAAVTATHNLLLRRLVRGDSAATSHELRTELMQLRSRFSAAAPATDGDVVVAVFRRGVAPERIIDSLRSTLDE
ncbi:TetR family transcriptional regulator [Skermania sp. ID1734]|uniref:TetR family transcriptional regulator n=1 Tax=Skermania sp. ID1734 TaxID=2597516 RepID=UPI00117F012E|nr:TetR family transcriptional regulator [Skermania sp. ID1734]TSD97368.1 TetR family transcriptional regulator [Skermania sp. ID1734]